MSKLVVFTYLSLDGVMQGPGGPEEDPSDGFDRGGWLVPYADEDMRKLVVDWISEADGFLLGRKTYEIFAAHWPHVGDEDPAYLGRLAKQLNSLPKYVASKSLEEPLEWSGSTLLNGDIAEDIKRLKREPGKEIWVWGSGDLIQTLMEHDLVDEYRLWFYPVVLGGGKRLFKDGSAPTALRLIDTKTTGAGVVVHTYRPAGEVRSGSFATER